MAIDDTRVGWVDGDESLFPERDEGCGVPHPVAAGFLCELPKGHDGCHAVLTWEVSPTAGASAHPSVGGSDTEKQP